MARFHTQLPALVCERRDEWPETVNASPVDSGVEITIYPQGDAEEQVRLMHRAELQWHARWAFRAVLAVAVFVAVAIRAGWLP